MLIRTWLIMGLIFIIHSCASVGSGHYVQLDPGESLETLSKRFDVPLWKLKAANRGRRIASSEWVFVPLGRGLMGAATNNYDTETYLSSGHFAWPVPSSKRISSGFGRRWGRAHEGIDIAARKGSHIIAADDGVVVYAGSELGGYGNIVVIGHEGGYFTIYAHNNRNHVRKGQKVYRGQVIAEVGASGRATGPHLHFEIRHDSRAINPKKYLAFRP